MLLIISDFMAFIWTFVTIGISAWFAVYWKPGARKSKLFDQVRHFQADLEWEAKSPKTHSLPALLPSSETGGMGLVLGRESNPDKDTNFINLFYE